MIRELILLSIVITIALLSLNKILAIRKIDSEKISPYECGFEPLGDARQKYDVRFYLVAILFIIFDLEVIFLFPLVPVLGKMSYYGYWVSMIFIIILTIGFIYEYKKGALKY